MNDTVNMKEQRDWLGRKRFVMDDSYNKPRTFYEEQSEAIATFAWGWMKIAAILAFAAFLLLLTPQAFSDNSEYVRMLGRVGAAAYGAGILFVVMNMPNLGITLIRGLALEFVTAGRK